MAFSKSKTYLKYPSRSRTSTTIKFFFFRTSSDTLKLQRLIDYLKSTGSDAGTKLESNASEYLTRVNVSLINAIWPGSI